MTLPHSPEPHPSPAPASRAQPSPLFTLSSRRTSPPTTSTPWTSPRTSSSNVSSIGGYRGHQEQQRKANDKTCRRLSSTIPLCQSISRREGFRCEILCFQLSVFGLIQTSSRTSIGPTLARPRSRKWLTHPLRCRDYRRQSHSRCVFFFSISTFHHKTTGQRTFITTPSLAPSRRSSTKAPQMAPTSLLPRVIPSQPTSVTS